MKLFIDAAILFAGSGVSAKETSWYYTYWIMSSSFKITDCSEVKGGYNEFVKKLRPQLESMGMDTCTESNSYGLKTNALICPSPSHNGNMITGYWFKGKSECESKVKEARSK